MLLVYIAQIILLDKGARNFKIVLFNKFLECLSHTFLNNILSYRSSPFAINRDNFAKFLNFSMSDSQSTPHRRSPRYNTPHKPQSNQHEEKTEQIQEEGQHKNQNFIDSQTYEQIEKQILPKRSIRPIRPTPTPKDRIRSQDSRNQGRGSRQSSMYNDGESNVGSETSSYLGQIGKIDNIEQFDVVLKLSEEAREVLQKIQRFDRFIYAKQADKICKDSIKGELQRIEKLKNSNKKMRLKLFDNELTITALYNLLRILNQTEAENKELKEVKSKLEVQQRKKKEDEFKQTLENRKNKPIQQELTRTLQNLHAALSDSSHIDHPKKMLETILSNKRFQETQWMQNNGWLYAYLLKLLTRQKNTDIQNQIRRGVMETQDELLYLIKDETGEKEEKIKQLMKNMDEWKKHIKNQTIGLQRELRNPKNTEKQSTGIILKNLQTISENMNKIQSLYNFNKNSRGNIKDKMAQKNESTIHQKGIEELNDSIRQFQLENSQLRQQIDNISKQNEKYQSKLAEITCKYEDQQKEMVSSFMKMFEGILKGGGDMQFKKQQLHKLFDNYQIQNPIFLGQLINVYDQYTKHQNYRSENQLLETDSQYVNTATEPKIIIGGSEQDISLPLFQSINKIVDTFKKGETSRQNSNIRIRQQEEELLKHIDEFLIRKDSSLSEKQSSIQITILEQQLRNKDEKLEEMTLQYNKLEEKLRRQIQELRKSEDISQSIRQLQKAISEKQEQINEYNQRQKQLNQVIETLKATISSQNQSVQTLKATVQDLDDQLNDMKSKYQQRNSDYITLLKSNKKTSQSQDDNSKLKSVYQQIVLDPITIVGEESISSSQYNYFIKDCQTKQTMIENLKMEIQQLKKQLKESEEKNKVQQDQKQINAKEIEEKLGAQKGQHEETRQKLKETQQLLNKQQLEYNQSIEASKSKFNAIQQELKRLKETSQVTILQLQQKLKNQAEDHQISKTVMKNENMQLLNKIKNKQQEIFNLNQKNKGLQNKIGELEHENNYLAESLMMEKSRSPKETHHEQNTQNDIPKSLRELKEEVWRLNNNITLHQSFETILEESGEESNEEGEVMVSQKSNHSAGEKSIGEVDVSNMDKLSEQIIKLHESMRENNDTLEKSQQKRDKLLQKMKSNYNDIFDNVQYLDEQFSHDNQSKPPLKSSSRSNGQSNIYKQLPTLTKQTTSIRNNLTKITHNIKQTNEHRQEYVSQQKNYKESSQDYKQNHNDDGNINLMNLMNSVQQLRFVLKQRSSKGDESQNLANQVPLSNQVSNESKNSCDSILENVRCLEEELQSLKKQLIDTTQNQSGRLQNQIQRFEKREQVLEERILELSQQANQYEEKLQKLEKERQNMEIQHQELRRLQKERSDKLLRSLKKQMEGIIRDKDNQITTLKSKVMKKNTQPSNYSNDANSNSQTNKQYHQKIINNMESNSQNSSMSKREYVSVSSKRTYTNNQEIHSGHQREPIINQMMDEVMGSMGINKFNMNPFSRRDDNSQQRSTSSDQIQLEVLRRINVEVADLVKLNHKLQTKIALLQRHQHLKGECLEMINFFIGLHEQMEAMIEWLLSKNYLGQNDLRASANYQQFSTNNNQLLINSDFDEFMKRWLEFMKSLFSIVRGDGEKRQKTQWRNLF